MASLRAHTPTSLFSFHLFHVRLKLVDAIDLAATNNNSVAKNAPASYAESADWLAVHYGRRCETICAVNRAT